MTTEPVPPVPVDLTDPTTAPNHHGRVYGPGPGTPIKDFPPRPDLPDSPLVSQIVKIKTPRKSKLASPVVSPSTNGTLSVFESDPEPEDPKLPKRMRIESGGSPPCSSNGIIPNNSLKKTPSPKNRKEKKVKSPDTPKRKYTKRKNPEFQLSPEQNINQCIAGSTSPTTNFISNSNQSLSGDNQWLHSFGCSNFPSSPTADQRLSPHKSPVKNQTVMGERRKGSEQQESEWNELKDMRVPNSNTHLLLSPQTLKRMLRSPSPATQNSTLTFSEEELDEEIIQASNSLFKDMSLNRQLKVPSPTEGSYTSSSTSTTSSSPHGRGRYSRRKFGRLYPPFDPNHCCRPHCLEGTLTGSKYCGSHVNGHLVKPSSVYGQCTYTDPLSLKPCKQTVYGEDDRDL